MGFVHGMCGCQGIADALDRHGRAALDQNTQRTLGRRDRRGWHRCEHRFVDSVAHIEHARVVATRAQLIGDPLRLGDEPERQVVREHGGHARRVVGRVEALLHALNEEGVARGGQMVQDEDGLPPRGDGNVPMLLARLLELEHGHVHEAAMGPVGRSLGCSKDELGVEAVIEPQPTGVLDDHADPAPQPQAVHEEGDPHQIALSNSRSRAVMYASSLVRSRSQRRSSVASTMRVPATAPSSAARGPKASR